MPFDGMEVRESCEDRPICPAERTSSTLPAAAARPSKPLMCSRRVMDVRLYGNRSGYAVQNDVDDYSRACALRTDCSRVFLDSAVSVGAGLMSHAPVRHTPAPTIAIRLTCSWRIVIPSSNETTGMMKLFADARVAS